MSTNSKVTSKKVSTIAAKILNNISSITRIGFGILLPLIILYKSNIPPVNNPDKNEYTIILNWIFIGNGMLSPI